jgi:4-hydroxy-tetrahydrodipicolinate synthase
VTGELAGAYPMVVTPFGADGSVAAEEIAAVVAHQLAAGCPGVSALGLAGEAGELTRDERLAVADAVLAAAGPGRAIIGCSADDTGHARELATAAATHGAAAIMLAAPAHGEPAGHFETVARAISPVPLIVQDAPAFLGITLGRAFIETLMERCENVRYAKPEGSPAVDLVVELQDVPGLGVLGGHGGLYLPDELAAGAIGTLPGPEAPAAHQAIVARWMRGDHDGARALHARLLPLLVVEFQGLAHYVASIKELLVALGLLSSAATRIAGPPLSAAGRRVLLETARRTGLTGLGEGHPEGEGHLG